MATKINQLTPAMAIHPGEMLKDELEARSITQKEFAQLTGIPQTQLNEIIKAKRWIYADTALLIGKALHMDAVIWTNLQMNYELDLAKHNEKNKTRLEAIDIWQMIQSYIPVKFFKKQGTISGNPVEDIPVIKQVYSIKNVEQLAAVYSQANYARFRKSEKLTIDKINLIGWVKLVSYMATQINLPGFDSRSKKELMETLKEIFRQNKNVVDKTKATLASHGIKLIIQPQPEKCPVDGISFWSNGHPAIGMTIRYNRLDNFAFTVLHELAHVYLHLVNNNTAEFIDLEKEYDRSEYKNSSEETEANEFARNALINKEAWNIFIADNPYFNEVAIRSFATKQKVHPSIALGRFQFETGCFKLRSSIDKTLH